MFSRKKRQAEGEGAEAKTHERRVVVGLPKDFVVSFILNHRNHSLHATASHMEQLRLLSKIWSENWPCLGWKAKTLMSPCCFVGEKPLFYSCFLAAEQAKSERRKIFENFPCDYFNDCFVVLLETHKNHNNK